QRARDQAVVGLERLLKAVAVADRSRERPSLGLASNLHADRPATRVATRERRGHGHAVGRILRLVLDTEHGLELACRDPPLARGVGRPTDHRRLNVEPGTVTARQDLDVRTDPDAAADLSADAEPDGVG